MIGFSQIRDFATLVNKSRIYDDDGRAKVNYYKVKSAENPMTTVEE
ncbi:hypothetical protein A2U01_0074582, partial [Trifolium medium]|nr:hypothetical protein [Trifolium medium]